ncbi:uncharacterized protein [Littorina saxatilis]|uniref:uncharacterized protein n=1 Tax=Littorina saxatilis TaxID=31220 RepID=UPI0038B47E0D
MVTHSQQFQMTSKNRNSPPTARRPLPPLPLLFCGSVVGGNICLLEEGRGAEWCPQLDLGSCGLDRPLKKGQEVSVEVTGTGYFSVVVRSKALAATFYQTTTPTTTSTNSKKDKGGTLKKSDIIDEVNFKLKKSKFTIVVERTSRSKLHVLATANETHTSKYDVNLSHRHDPWVTFNVLFGDLRLIVNGCAGKHEKPWQFHTSHGLNINLRKTLQEAEAILYNPCAIVVTERPLDKGEIMEVSVEPHSADSHSEVKIYLTHNGPFALKLQNPRVFFHENKNVERFLHEVYVIKKFKGTMTLRIDEEAGTLDVQEDTSDGHRLTQPATHSVDLFQNGLNVRKPMRVCLEILRTTVHIRQRSKGRDSSYAEPVPGQGVEESLDRHDMSDADGYLAPSTAKKSPSKQPLSSRPPMLPPDVSASPSTTTRAWVHPPPPRPYPFRSGPSPSIPFTPLSSHHHSPMNLNKSSSSLRCDSRKPRGHTLSESSSFPGCLQSPLTMSPNHLSHMQNHTPNSSLITRSPTLSSPASEYSSSPRSLQSPLTMSTNHLSRLPSGWSSSLHTPNSSPITRSPALSSPASEFSSSPRSLQSPLTTSPSPVSHMQNGWSSSSHTPNSSPITRSPALSSPAGSFDSSPDLFHGQELTQFSPFSNSPSPSPVSQSDAISSHRSSPNSSSPRSRRHVVQDPCTATHFFPADQPTPAAPNTESAFTFPLTPFSNTREGYSAATSSIPADQACPVSVAATAAYGSSPLSFGSAPKPCEGRAMAYPYAITNLSPSEMTGAVTPDTVSAQVAKKPAKGHGPYMSMDGYIQPSARFLLTKTTPASASLAPPVCHQPVPCYLTPVPSPDEAHQTGPPSFCAPPEASAGVKSGHEICLESDRQDHSEEDEDAALSQSSTLKRHSSMKLESSPVILVPPTTAKSSAPLGSRVPASSCSTHSPGGDLASQTTSTLHNSEKRDTDNSSKQNTTEDEAQCSLRPKPTIVFANEIPDDCSSMSFDDRASWLSQFTETLRVEENQGAVQTRKDEGTEAIQEHRRGDRNDEQTTAAKHTQLTEAEQGQTAIVLRRGTEVSQLPLLLQRESTAITGCCSAGPLPFAKKGGLSQSKAKNRFRYEPSLPKRRSVFYVDLI